MFTILIVLACIAFLLALSQPKSEPWPHPSDDENGEKPAHGWKE